MHRRTDHIFGTYYRTENLEKSPVDILLLTLYWKQQQTSVIVGFCKVTCRVNTYHEGPYYLLFSGKQQISFPYKRFKGL